MPRWSATLVVAVIAAGCGDGVPKPAPMDPITAEEAAEIGHRFDLAVDPCEAHKIDALIDIEQWTREVMARTHLQARDKRDALAGIRSRGAFLGTQMCGSLAATPTFDFVRVHEVDGRPRALLRATGPAGVNYYELIAGKSKSSGVVRIVDVYLYMSGETLGETVARTIDDGMAASREHPIAAMEQLGAARSSNDRARVRELIAGMPATLRDGKSMRLLDLQMAQALDAPDYVELIDRYAQAFPGDPSVDFVSIDAYFARKQVGPLLAAIDRLDQRVGGDPYLEYLRSASLALEPTPEHLAEADRRARIAAEALSDRVDLWWNLIAIQLLRADFAAVVTTLDMMHTRFGVTVDPAVMATSDVWRGFLASPEFASWRPAPPP